MRNCYLVEVETNGGHIFHTLCRDLDAAKNLFHAELRCGGTRVSSVFDSKGVLLAEDFGDYALLGLPLPALGTDVFKQRQK